MSQQPPEWWSRQRGPRIGCADVTIVSIASITAFVILIFVLFRPDFAKVVDVTNRNGESTVSAVRATETPSSPKLGGSAPVATTPPAAAATTSVAAPPTVTPPAQAQAEPTPTFRRALTTDECRLRQDTSYKAVIIQVFKLGSPFKVYSEQRYDDEDKVLFYRVESDTDARLQGWMVSTCFKQ